MRGTALTPLGVEDVKRELPEIFGAGPTLGKVGGVGPKEWKWGGNMRPWSDYYRRFGDPLGPERSTGAFKELMKTSFGTFPS